MISKFICIDTETCNSLIDENEKLDLSQSLVYDVGWTVFDKKNTVYKTRSYVVAEIFLDSVLMDSAYYKDKIPQYWEDIKNGTRQLKSFKNIRLQYLRDLKFYKIKATMAHNAYFDYNALNTTLRYLTNSRYRYWFPYKNELWDTLKMSRDVLRDKKAYTEYCDKHGYKTKHKIPQNRYTAEILNRFIKGDENFIESHTGLEDTLIEKDIFLYCLKQKKGMRKKLFSRAC